MRIIISDFMSLDGVVQAPGQANEDTDGGFRHGGWSMPFFDPEVMGEFIGSGFRETEALLFGRRTWRVMADAWPNRAGDEFADQMNAIPKYVASRTLTDKDLDWNNTTLLGGDAIPAIRELRAQPGGGLQVMGSASLARQLVDNDLVDEINVMIEPVLLGGGKRIFPDGGRKRELELVTTAIAKTGVVICKYRAQPSS
jgi:dihydrofolate reductase